MKPRLSDSWCHSRAWGLIATLNPRARGTATKIDIVIGHRQTFIESTQLVEQRAAHQQARSRDRGNGTRSRQLRVLAKIAFLEPATGVLPIALGTSDKCPRAASVPSG